MKKNKQFRYYALVVAAVMLGSIGVLYGVYFFLPYTLIRAIADRMASDGSADGLTVALCNQMRAGAAIGCASSLFLSMSIFQARRQDLSFILQWKIKTVEFFKKDRFAWIWLAFVIGVAAWIRLQYMTLPMRCDESFTYLLARTGLVHVLSDYSLPNNHILHTILVFVSTHIFGGVEWAVRLPAFLSGLFLCFLVFLVSFRVFKSAYAGIFSSVFVCISPILIGYSANGRGYTMQACFMAILLGLAEWVRRTQLDERSEQEAKLAITTFTTTIALCLYLLPTSLYIIVCAISVLALEDNLLPNWRRTRIAIGSSVYGGAIALFLYSPAMFRSGPTALLANRFIVRADSIQPTLDSLRQAWISETAGWPGIATGLLIVLICLGIIIERFNRRLFVGLLLILLLAILQHGAPPARIWVFLAVVPPIIVSAVFSRLMGYTPAGGQKYLATALLGLILLLGSVQVQTASTWTVLNSQMDTLPESKVVSDLMRSQVKDGDAVFLDASYAPPVRYYLLTVKERVVLEPHPSSNPNRLFVVCNSPQCRWSVLDMADSRFSKSAAIWNQGSLPDLNKDNLIFSTRESGVHLIQLRQTSN